MNRLLVGRCPHLTEETIKVLHKSGINSVIDFITEDVPNLSEKTSLPAEELLAIRTSLLLEHSSVAYNGDYLFEEMIGSLKVISTGCENRSNFISLDQLLGGGLFSKELTELYGSPASGKTQSCLSIACHVAVEYQKNVVYVDTGAGFSGGRIKEIIARKCEKDGIGMNYLNHLNRIQCIKAFDILSALAVLEDLGDSLSAQEDVFYQDTVMVIFDSVAGLISPILGATQNHGHALMVSLGRMLKSLALDYNLAVLPLQAVTTATIAEDGLKSN